jgi:XTP/dITP diphosphohydrolase
MEELKKELGDILLQVVFHSNIAEEEKSFTLKDVIEFETKKLIERHPHVFGDLKVSGSEEVKRNWERMKKNEGRKSIVDGIPEELPALFKAYRIQEKASKVGFDWKDGAPVLEKITEEINELKQNVESGKSQPELEDELGDVLFSIVNYARFLKLNPEDALRRTVKKFKERFQKIEEYARENNKELEHMTLDEMDEIWEKAKSPF